MSKASQGKASIVDRVSVGMLSGVAALLTGAFIWFLVFYSLSMLDIDYQPPFMYVIVFSVVMFVLGFATMNNLVSNILGSVWHFLYRWLRFWE